MKKLIALLTLIAFIAVPSLPADEGKACDQSKPACTEKDKAACPNKDKCPFDKAGDKACCPKAGEKACPKSGDKGACPAGKKA